MTGKNTHVLHRRGNTERYILSQILPLCGWIDSSCFSSIMWRYLFHILKCVKMGKIKTPVSCMLNFLPPNTMIIHVWPLGSVGFRGQGARMGLDHGSKTSVGNECFNYLYFHLIITFGFSYTMNEKYLPTNKFEFPTCDLGVLLIPR